MTYRQRYREPTLGILTDKQWRKIEEHKVWVVDEKSFTFRHDNCGRTWSVSAGGRQRLPNGWYLCPHCDDETQRRMARQHVS